MNNNAVKLLLPILALAASVLPLQADSIYYSANSAPDRLWSTTDGWKKYDGSALGRLPGSYDALNMDSSQTSPTNPLVIPAGCNAVAQYVRLATSNNGNNYASDGRIPSLTISGRLQMTNPYNNTNTISVGHANGGFGLLRIESGGIITNANLMIGYEGIGVVTNNGGSVHLVAGYDNCFTIGGGGGEGGLHTGEGTYVQNDGLLVLHDKSAYIGWYAPGTMEISGGVMKVPNATVYCGYKARGTATISSAIIQQAYLKIGGTTNCVSEMTIESGGTNQVTSSMYVGGYPIPVNGSSEPMPGCGILTLRGGTAWINNNATTVNFHIGRYAEGWGCLRGYGEIAPKTQSSSNIRMAGGNCIILADGYGEERDLDLHLVVSITNYFPETNISGSTNGWYAINKGRVKFPRTYFSTTDADRCNGDFTLQTKPRFVNSVWFSVTGAGSKQAFRGELYAPDRSDIPAGLPQDKTVIGVWNLGLYTGTDDSTLRDFTNITLKFRYDHTKVKEGETVKLYRYNGTAWTNVGTATESRTGEHLISTGSLSKLTTGSSNIGFFAALVSKPGLVILIR